MKIHLITFTCLGLCGWLVPTARGFQQPQQPELPNLDVRSASPPVSPTLVQRQAAAALKARLPEVQLDTDKLLGSPRLISNSRGFLTGPNGRGKAVTAAAIDSLPVSDPHRAIKAFVNEHRELFGHDATALEIASVTSDYVTEHNGMRTVVWQQQADDIPIFEALFIGHLTAKGELISVSSRFVPAPETAAANGRPHHRALVARPTISAAKAVAIAARNLGADLEETSMIALAGPDSFDKRQSFRATGLRGEARAQLRWLLMDRDSMRLCWRVELTARVRAEMYSLLVDVETGEVLVRRCLTAYIKPATYNVYLSDSPSPFSPGWSTPSTTQPPTVSRRLVTLTAINTNASPNGWINDADDETRGNNVDAHTDLNDDDAPDVPRPQGVGPGRVFDFPLDLTKAPSTYSAAAVVNLFYWNNFMHDKLYELGFTEAAGNFQNNNFGRGGAASDAVLADAQDGGGYNNANFSTPPDGSPGRMQMYIFNGPNPDRDGDLDSEVMCHEYTHGLSNRLVGGGVGISALQTAGMGEGWSDFYSLSLLSEADDDVNGNYAAGGYASYRLGGTFNQNYYFGIRRYPYTTDKSKNPLTFKDIDPSQASAHAGVPISPLFGGTNPAEVHNQGEVWCVTLWEARVALVEKLGFPDGNQTMMKLVTDGMKLAPPNPNFLEARDAILRADQIDTGGDNYNELWIAFAKRGMGYTAKAPPSDTTIGVVEKFDLPPDVVITVPDGILEVSLTPPPNSALLQSTPQPIFFRITDSGAVTNAKISATINGSPLTFRNDGVAPDVTANNSVYSASYTPPANTTSAILNYSISATNKDTATGSVSYLVIPLPQNDYFTNATKIPANGGSYVSNNKQAGLELPDEPTHAGVASVSASLWWYFAPTNDGRILVDTAGSTFDTIVAVYTNATLATLGEVASANDVGPRSQAFVYFNGRAGTTYRIAVASASPSSTGTVNLNVAPNGIPDTNAPVVTVTSPLSGLLVTSNRVLVTGTAVDPDPVPSGIYDVTIRVNPTGVVDSFNPATASLIVSSNWSRLVGLTEGFNTLTVTSTDVAGNKSLPVTLQVLYRPNDPVNDVFANAIVLTNTAGVSSVNNNRATKELNEPDHAGNTGGKSVWWFFTPPADGLLSLTTTNSTFDTLLALYTGTQVSDLTQVASSDDAYPGAPGGFSALSQAVLSNQTYRIAVDGFDGASGVVYLAYTFTPATVFSLTTSAGAGGQVSPPFGLAVSNSTVVVVATPDLFFEFDSWTGSLSSIANPLSVVVNSNLILTARFRQFVFTDDFETGDLSKLPWTSAPGSPPWTVQANTVLRGNFSAQSGAIGNGQSTSLLLTTNFHDGAASFYLKVSSEPDWDFLSFSVDDVEQQRWSGQVDWTGYSFPLTAGNHKLEWRYSKDASFSSGSDAAFIDNVLLPIGLPIDASTPAYLEMVRQPDGSLLLMVLGQTNRQYVIQGATSLTSPIGWQNLSTNIATGGVIQYVDPGTGTNPIRYYRAIVP